MYQTIFALTILRFLPIMREHNGMYNFKTVISIMKYNVLLSIITTVKQRHLRHETTTVLCVFADAAYLILADKCNFLLSTVSPLRLCEVRFGFILSSLPSSFEWRCHRNIWSY